MRPMSSLRGLFVSYWTKAPCEGLVGMIGGQRNGHPSQRSCRRKSPESEWRYVPGQNRSRLDDGAFTDSDSGQDDTMWTNEYVSFDNHFPISTPFLSRPPVEVGEDRCPEADGDVVTDGDCLGMEFVDIDKLADPHVFPDFCSPPLVEPWPQRVPTGCEKCKLIEKPVGQIRRHGRLSY
jgi:hypothetical protein